MKLNPCFSSILTSAFIVSINKIDFYTAEMIEFNGILIPDDRRNRDVLEWLSTPKNVKGKTEKNLLK